MRVLFLMFTFPDMNKSFNMYTALVDQFRQNGHDVYVVAPAVSGSEGGIVKENGLDVLRVKTLPMKNVPFYVKGIANLILPGQYERALKKYYPHTKFDLIITPTPNIALVDLAAKLKNKHQAKLYLILRDIFPQGPVDLGFLRKRSMIYNYFRKKEKKLYRISDGIGCMSDGNVKYIRKHNPELPPEKVHELKNFQVLYTGYGNDYAHLRKKYQLEDKYVVVFGGNMGKAQQLGNVLKLAKSCMEHPDVLFLLLGEGVAMDRVKNMAKNEGITNIRIQGTIPKQEYQDLLSVSNIGLISLYEHFTVMNIPSKSLDYFNVGIPVLASIDRSTDFDKVIEEALAGLWSYSGDHEAFKKNFDKLYADAKLREQMGKNGRKYFEKYLTPDIAYETVMKSCYAQELV